MALGDYLAGEVAEDFEDGLLTRRESLRASACSSSASPPRVDCWRRARPETTTPRARAAIAPRPTPPRQTNHESADAEVITFDGHSGEVTAANVRPIHGRGGEVWGAESAADKLVVVRPA